MGTVIARKRKSGSTAYLAQISLMRDGKFAHRESKTFDRRQAALAWIEMREEELKTPGVIERKNATNSPLSVIIDRYTSESIKEIGRTKAQVLNAIKSFSIADKHCSEITSADIVSFAKEKLATGVQPQTVATYLSYLASVFTVARPAWGYALDDRAMGDAWEATKYLGITATSAKRIRRPTLDEMDKLMAHFADIGRRRPSSIPMLKIVAFALFSTRRQEEIIRIRWDDLDVERKRILVRDMKSPVKKLGNNVRCDLPDEALQLIQSMPRLADEIFPYTTDAISAAFTRACKFLMIEDLRFHDLRHDGISRLFEMGWNIPKVAAVSGHRSWQSLQRYTHLDRTGDKYAGWPWLGAAVACCATRVQRQKRSVALYASTRRGRR